MKALISIIIAILIPSFCFAEGINENWQRDAIKAIKKVDQDYNKVIQFNASRYNVSDLLIKAIIVVESLGNPKAVSKSNAKGLMQTKQIIDKEIGVYGDSFKSWVSISKGTAYIARLRDHYGYDRVAKVVVAYNNGPIAARKMSREDFLQHPYYKKVAWVLEKMIWPEE